MASLYPDDDSGDWDAGPSGNGMDDDDEGMDVMSFMESHMDEDEDDYDEGNVVEVEPDVILGSEGVVAEEYDDEDSIMQNDVCSVCQVSLDHHQDGQPCQMGGFGGDHFLDDSSSSNCSFLVNNSTERVTLGPTCPICDNPLGKQHTRDHVCTHFMDELKLIVGDTTSCKLCDYKGEKPDNVARHLGLFHSKLDEFLTNPEIVAEKRHIAKSKPKRISVGSTCIICGMASPSREHVARHFMKELMEIVTSLGTGTQCPECSFKGEKQQNLARHIALVHSKLDEILMDGQLVSERRQEFQSKPNKLTIGPNCPVCDAQLSKQHSRVHVIWHFIEDLREMVSNFANPNECEYCDYSNTNSDKVAKHIALGHSKLDELLMDKQLVAKKRKLAMLKPKKESIGPLCPICDVKDPPRDHVARHFGEEMGKHVASLPVPNQCNECSYKAEKQKNLELHIALVHGYLDAFLKDKELMRQKRTKFMSTPKKLTIGPKCPICDMQFTKSQNRDHVSWHFMEDIREIVQKFPSQNKCIYCDYSSDKMDNLVKHIALGHSKLDELLQDPELVAAKRAKALSKPKKIAVGPLCPICDMKDPTREHVSRHFGEELLVYINEFENPLECNECEYKGDKPKTLAIHVALVHGKLDLILGNDELVSLKRAKFMAKPKKQSIGPVCPVCDVQFTKNQNRDHVAWHYMDELRAIVQQFPDPSQCTQCPYSSDSMEKMVKHVALGHSMLDGFLQDQDLLQMKRLKVLSKPKKVQLGPTCPVCDVKDPPREHVARHFGDELLDIVMDFPDEKQCTECSYSNEKPKNVAIHIALVHNILDQILTNDELVKEKRDKFMSKPQKVNVGNQCPICDQPFPKGPNRDHICWHFIEELRAIVLTFPDQEACKDCSYRSDKLDNLVKHVALGHSKLDELLMDEELVARKREIAQLKPKKMNIGPSCPVCDHKFSKGQNRDHVSWHFMDELREFVKSTGYEKQCTLCNYVTDKMDNLVKHYALGHSKLDELLQDEELVAAKRKAVKNKPKRLSFGKECPICGLSGRDRDHIARHFMPELMELVNALPKKSKCDKCDYSNAKNDYMAKHIALFHCKLDEMMLDKDLVAEKQRQVKNAPKKVSMGENCIICGISMPSREHVARHFLAELSQIVLSKTTSPLSCPDCSFSADKEEYVARHMGLVHCEIDRLIQDGDIVSKKIAEYQGVNGVQAAVGTNSPTPTKALPVREAVRKSQRQRELEEKQAAEDKRRLEIEKEIREREKEEREKEREERKRKKEEEMASKLAANSQPPAKKIKVENSPEKTSILEKSLLKSPPKPSESLLMATLLKGQSEEENKWSLEPPKEGSLSIKIKRASPTSKWQVKSPIKDNSGIKVTASITPISRIKSEDDSEMVVEPDLSDLMVPEISHNLEDDEDQNDEIVIEPQIYLNEEDDQDESEEIFCNECGFELDGHDDENCGSKKQLVKYSKCQICDFEIPSREHISRHFLPELMEVVECFPDPRACPQCEFKSHLPDNVGVHIAIAHNQLEKCLKDSSLVLAKKNEAFAQSLEKPKRKSPSKAHLPDIPMAGVKTHLTPSVTIMRQPSKKPTKSASNTPPTACVSCPICDQMISKSHSRDHIAWHFMEELRAMINPEDPNKCPKCNYKGERSDNVAKHIALFHGQLDKFLSDSQLVSVKRTKALSKPKKAVLGSLCPVCDFKDPPREHVCRHFMPEFLAQLEGRENQVQCTECNYRGEKPQNLAKHIALVHSLLDQVLHNETLVAERRAEFMAKPKKVSIGDHCPVCEMAIPKRDSRVHVIWHFMDDFKEMVAGFVDPKICDICGYENRRPDKMAKHVALGHSKLDEMLMDEELVQRKKEILKAKPQKPTFTFSPSPQAFNRPKKIMVGYQCPICDMQFAKAHNRDHVSGHFMDELKEIVNALPDPTKCVMCDYTSEKVENFVKHLALGHSKLDEFLMDEELVAKKREIAMNKPKRYPLGDRCPICDYANPQRDHVARHFFEELLAIGDRNENDLHCPMQNCSYKGDRQEYLAKHLALFHCKLDEYLYDADFVLQKRNAYLAKMQYKEANPSSGSTEVNCSICHKGMVKKSLREHMAKHFSVEIFAIIDTFERSNSCDLCNGTYKTHRKENMLRHVALVHGKLDEYMANEEMVQEKIDAIFGNVSAVSVEDNGDDHDLSNFLCQESMEVGEENELDIEIKEELKSI